MRQPGPRIPRVSPFFPSTSASLSLPRHSRPRFHLLLILVYYSMGARRCSLIDGTGHSRAARKKERGKRKRKRKGGRGKTESESDEGRKRGGWGRPPHGHHRLIYNAGGVTEFTIKIPRSAALMDRRAPRNAGDDSGIFK